MILTPTLTLALGPLLEAVAELCKEGFSNCDMPFRLMTEGVVVSKPGSAAQGFHYDGLNGGVFNVFISLVDVERDADGTQFWTNSHRSVEGAQFKHRYPPADVNKIISQSESPGVQAGDMIIFDYPLIHRGLPNKGTRIRPVAYFTFNARKGQSAHVLGEQDDGANWGSLNLQYNVTEVYACSNIMTESIDGVLFKIMGRLCMWIVGSACAFGAMPWFYLRRSW